MSLPSSSVSRGVKRLALFAAVLLLAARCGNPNAPSVNVAFSAVDTVVGAGATAATGNTVTVSYTGWLYDASKADKHGNQFDTSSSFTFVLGGNVIAGWNQGIPGMKVGGTRILTIPPSLGYGSVATGPIPANSTLVFTVTLLSVV